MKKLLVTLLLSLVLFGCGSGFQKPLSNNTSPTNTSTSIEKEKWEKKERDTIFQTIKGVGEAVGVIGGSGYLFYLLVIA